MSATSETSTDERLRLITRNLKEVIGKNITDGCLERTGTLNVYWGTAPTGRPHIAYFLPMVKLADFLKAECEVTILFADLHAYLDNVKAPWELLDKRTEYYEILIKGVLKSLKVPIDRLRFIRGTHFQLEENYTKAVYQIIRLTSVRDAIKAGCDVVKQNSDPMLSSLIYPLLQALDEEFLDVDAQFGGLDQRKIFVYAEENLPFLFFAKRAHLMNAMIPGLTGGKMSASEENSKIDLLDSEETLKTKLQSANCEGKTSEKNGILAFLEHIALPMKDQLNIGGLNKYSDINQIYDDFSDGKVTEEDLKDLVGSILWSLMSPLKDEFVRIGKEKLIDEAYPEVLPESTVMNGKHLKNKTLSGGNLADLRGEFPYLSDAPIEKAPTIEDQPSIMWSCRCSGEPHIGYLIPIKKLATLSKKNWKVIILIEDIGAFLHSKHNSNRTSWDHLVRRAQAYREMCEKSFELFGGNRAYLEIVLGSEFQLSREYMLQLYQCLTKVRLAPCTQILETLYNDSNLSKNLSSVIYPCLSALDQQHLRPTVRVFGERVESVDKQLITAIGLEHRRPIYAYHENLMALDGKSTMSSPELGPKGSPVDIRSISLYDNEDTINMKMTKAFMDPSNLDCHPILSIIDRIIWQHLAGSVLHVQQGVQGGGDVTFKSVADIKGNLQSKQLHPKDLKAAISKHLADLIINPLSLTSSSFTIQGLEPSRELCLGSFNPNKINLHVAKVKSITFTNSLYNVNIRCGINDFIIYKKTDCYFTPNDLCLVIVRPSTSTTPSTIKGIVRLRDQTSLKLIKKTYMNRVTFANHGSSVPHFEDIDLDLLVKRVEENLVIRGKHLVWKEDGSRANEIGFYNGGDGDLPITIDRSLMA